MKTKASRSPGTKRWMLVDDDEGALMFMRMFISKLGVTEVECFTCAEEALAAFETAPDSFELVITDFQMPGMDGVELARRLLALAPNIKILLTTGSHLFNDEVAAREGFSGFLKKPYQVTSLEHVFGAIAAREFPGNPPQKRL